MNYLWIAIPSDLIEEIGPEISQDYGLIEISAWRNSNIWRNARLNLSPAKIDFYQVTLMTSI